MNQFVSKPRTNAFTLVEILTVIAIISILAALLLPVLNSSQRRAQRIWCENNLQQMGIAFHVFANDHAGKFPMAVPANDGGSQEFVQSGFSTNNVFYTSFHSFQSLSNELVTPHLLICVADLARGAASNFPALQNENLSYFIGVNGTFDKPGSILAGDRNLATNALETPTILQIGPASRLSWTWEIHRFQGNVLFADSHVEEWNNSGLKTGGGQISPNENLFLPSVVPSANPSPDAMNASQSSTAGSSSQSPSMPPISPNPMMPVSGGANQQMSRTDSAPPPSESSSDTAAAASATATNAVVGMALPGEPNSMMSSFDRNLNKTLLHTFEWLYLLLLLLALFYLLRKYRKWKREREARQHAKRMREESPWD